MVDEQKLRQLAEAAKPWQMDTAGQTDEQQEEGTASVGVMNGDGEFLAVAFVDTGLYDMPALALPLAEYMAAANPAAILSLLDELQTLREERTAWRVTAENAEAAVKQAREALEHCLGVLEQADCSTGYCCCGSATEGHTLGDGHSPVDAGDYYQSQAMESARAAIESLKGTP